MTWLAQRKKAIVAFIVPNIPAVVAFVTARWGAGVAAEVVAVASALGVHAAPNAA